MQENLATDIHKQLHAVEQYLLKHGPQNFPKLHNHAEQWDIFEQMMETNTAISVDDNTKMVRLPEVEKELFEYNAGHGPTVLPLFTIQQHIQKSTTSTKYPYIKTNPNEIIQKIIDYTLNSNSSFVWGDSIYFAKDNRQKSPTMNEYSDLCEIFRFFDYEDKNNSITDPFCETQVLKKINKAWPSIIKHNPMFFTLSTGNATQSTVTCNYSAFIFGVTVNNELEIRNSQKTKAIQRVSAILLIAYIKNHLRLKCNGSASLEVLLSAINGKSAPAQLRLYDIDTSAKLLEFLKTNGPPQLTIEETTSNATISVPENLAWEALCFDLVKKTQKSETSSDKLVTCAISEPKTDEVISMDHDEFVLYKKSRQQRKKDCQVAPAKARSKSSKPQKSSRTSADKTKKNSGHSSNQKSYSKAPSRKLNQISLQQSRFHERSTQSSRMQPNVNLRKRQENPTRQKVLQNKSAVSHFRKSGSGGNLPKSSSKDLPAPFPDYKSKPQRQLGSFGSGKSFVNQSNRQPGLNSKASFKNTKELPAPSSPATRNKFKTTEISPKRTARDVSSMLNSSSPHHVKVSPTNSSPKINNSSTNSDLQLTRQAKINERTVASTQQQTNIHVAERSFNMQNRARTPATPPNGRPTTPLTRKLERETISPQHLTIIGTNRNVQVAHQQPISFIQPSEKCLGSSIPVAKSAIQSGRTGYLESSPKKRNITDETTPRPQHPHAGNTAIHVKESNIKFVTEEQLTGINFEKFQRKRSLHESSHDHIQLSAHAKPFSPATPTTPTTSDSTVLQYFPSADAGIVQKDVAKSTTYSASKLYTDRKLQLNNDKALVEAPAIQNTPFCDDTQWTMSEQTEDIPLLSKDELLADVLKKSDRMHINVLFLRCQTQQQSFQNIQDLLQYVENKPGWLQKKDCWVEIASQSETIKSRG